MMLHAAAPRPLEVEILVRLPADTPVIDWAAALTALSDRLGGTWGYRAAPGQSRGRYEIEIRQDAQPPTVAQCPPWEGETLP